VPGLSVGPLGLLDTKTLGASCDLFTVVLSFTGKEAVLPFPSKSSSPKILSLAAWYLASRSFNVSLAEDEGGGVGDLEFDSEGRLRMRRVGWNAPGGGVRTWCGDMVITAGIGLGAFAFLEPGDFSKESIRRDRWPIERTRHPKYAGYPSLSLPLRHHRLPNHHEQVLV